MARQGAILNALPANIALLDIDGTILSVNDGWRSFATANTMLCGSGQRVGLNYLEICDNATGAGSHEAHLAADGVVMHGNVSARRRDESSIASLAERLSLATEVAKVGVWQWDLGSDALTWDKTMFAIYGFPQTCEMSYAKWSAAIHPEDLQEVEAKLQRAIDTRSEETAEFRIIASDGDLRHVAASEKAVVDQSGNVCRVVGVNVDVTERKKAEEELRNNQVSHDLSS
jgi:PAS domain S-box-containing protein